MPRLNYLVVLPTPVEKLRDGYLVSEQDLKHCTIVTAHQEEEDLPLLRHGVPRVRQRRRGRRRPCCPLVPEGWTPDCSGSELCQEYG